MGNVIGGGPGDDSLIGTPGDDTILGYGGNDVLEGRAGNDTLYGDGYDTLKGQGGSDTIIGEAGDDILFWDAGDAVMDGGTGTDTLRVAGGDVDLTTFTGTITGIEKVDLFDQPSGEGLILTAQDVLDISDTDTITVLGKNNDTVDAGTGWTDGGLDGSGNQIYTQMVGAQLATLLLDPDIAVNPDILT